MPILEINVVNKHHGTQGEYIGRGSPLGNPYKLNDNEPRGSTIMRYSRYLYTKVRERDEAICNELQRLAELAMEGPLNLQCFCHPQPCHGDVIKELLETTIMQHDPSYTVKP